MKLGLLSDFLEEGWPSMDLCAERLKVWLPEVGDWQVTELRPAYRGNALVRWLPRHGRLSRTLRNAARWWNRQRVYPAAARRSAAAHDRFHIVDHSYAFLAHALPAAKTTVYCHDLDAFRCLIDPAAEPRPRWFRDMAARTLGGMQRAAAVFYSTRAVGDRIEALQLIPAQRLVHAPYGVDEAFVPAEEGAVWPAALAGLDQGPWLLHVGGTIPRKRIDRVVRIMERLRQRDPRWRLVKVGADWTAEQQTSMRQLVADGAVVHLGKVDLATLIQAYQRTAGVLVTSDAEGFGLPVIEAMACGARVLASDLPVLRETGGASGRYVDGDDVDGWVDAILAADSPGDRADRIAWARRFSWRAHAQVVSDVLVGHSCRE